MCSFYDLLQNCDFVAKVSFTYNPMRNFLNINISDELIEPGMAINDFVVINR